MVPWVVGSREKSERAMGISHADAFIILRKRMPFGAPTRCGPVRQAAPGPQTTWLMRYLSRLSACVALSTDRRDVFELRFLRDARDDSVLSEVSDRP